MRITLVLDPTTPAVPFFPTLAEPAQLTLVTAGSLGASLLEALKSTCSSHNPPRSLVVSLPLLHLTSVRVQAQCPFEYESPHALQLGATRCI